MSLGPKVEPNFVLTFLVFPFIPCVRQKPTGVCLLLEGKPGLHTSNLPLIKDGQRPSPCQRFPIMSC